VDASITIALRTRDNGKGFSLQKAAEVSEANKLWREASRANTNLGYILNYDFQPDIAYQYHLRTIEIHLHTGDIDGLFFVLGNLEGDLIKQGHLNTIEDELAEILHRSTAPQSRIEKFLDSVRSDILSPRGEWAQALDYWRCLLKEARKTNKYQIIVSTNFELVDVNLELNCFLGMPDLSEAESAVEENIGIRWDGLHARFLQVVVFSRQNRLAEAHERLAEIVKNLNQLPNDVSNRRAFTVFRLNAEAELAKAERDWEEAVAKCKALIDIYQSGSCRWNWARQLIDFGDCLIGRDLPGDREHAEQAYRESLEMFTEMGATGYIQVLEERLRGL
jgi:tetratricopeptide (TPR) repeat protein